MANGIPHSTALRSPVFLVTAFLCFFVNTLQYGEEPARRIGFLLEGNFENHEIARMAEGANKTLLVPFYKWDYGVRPFSEAEWKKQGLSWEKVGDLTSTSMEQLIKKVKPDVVRDDRGIVEYVIIADKDPFLTGLVLSPFLREAYQELLGDRIHAIPIDRNRIYLFPATGGKLSDYGPAIVDEFRRAPLPVSLEIFLIDKSGYRVIGELRRGG